jgi:hypothetical protein
VQLIKIFFQHRFFVLVIALIAVASVGIGCGGSDDDGGGSLTRADVIRQADANCEASNEALQAKYLAFQKSHKGPGETLDDGEKEEVAKTIMRPAIQTQFEGIESLGSPEGDEEKTAAIASAYEKALAEGKQKPLIFLYAFEGPLSAVQKLTKDFGFRVCGQVYG